MAAIFPEVAALIASPTWRATAAERRTADLERLLDTAARALDCPSVGHGHSLANAIMIWVATGPPAR